MLLKVHCKKGKGRSFTKTIQFPTHIDFQGIGIGHTFLDRVKEQSSGRLTLYTFEVNEKAQQFYLKNMISELEVYGKIIEKMHLKITGEKVNEYNNGKINNT